MARVGEQYGPYRLEERLGSGSFGAVFRATREGGVPIPVAVKIPHDQAAGAAEFLKEAEVWVRAAGHPNVVPVQDAAVYDDDFVLVSEYVEGGALRRKIGLRTGQGLPPAEAAELVLGILRGLEHLHSRGVIHRDLKPENVLLQSGTPRLTDFGVSRVLTRSTHTGRISGTLAYMPPEAIQGRINPQTDIWAAGVILFELLAGALPFDGANEFAMMDAIRSGPLPPLPAHVPPALTAIAERALDRDPGARYPTARSMRVDLEPVLRALHGSADPPARTQPPPDPTPGADPVLPQAPTTRAATPAPPPPAGPRTGSDLSAATAPPRPEPVRGADLAAMVELRAADAAQGGRRLVAISGGGTQGMSLPPGLRDGEELRLPGLGRPGQHGGPAGDLCLRVRVVPDAGDAQPAAGQAIAGRAEPQAGRSPADRASPQAGRARADGAEPGTSPHRADMRGEPDRKVGPRSAGTPPSVPPPQKQEPAPAGPYPPPAWAGATDPRDSTTHPSPPPPDPRRGLPQPAKWLIGIGAVVAVLVVVLAPVFEQARASARRADCRSNLKQLGTGLMMYVQDYDERLPPAREWSDMLHPYTKNTQVLICPERSGVPGYAFHLRLDRISLASIERPADWPAIFDSSAAAGNFADRLESFDARHGANSGQKEGEVCFVDGHAKGLRIVPLPSTYEMSPPGSTRDAKK